MAELLIKTLESLNKRMGENNKILVQQEVGYLGGWLVKEEEHS
jgi:hypothetical protein